MIFSHIAPTASMSKRETDFTEFLQPPSGLIAIAPQRDGSPRVSSPVSLEEFIPYRDRKFVVVLAVGRSGSTLLQGVLNALPGFLIRGENFGFMHGLYSSYLSLQRAKRFVGSDRASHSWFGSMELDDAHFAEDAAPIVARQLVGARAGQSFAALGFKEIRWMELNGPNENLWGFFRFIETVFRRTYFILLTRDIDEIMKSGWWPSVENASSRLGIEEFYALARLAKVRNLFELDYANLRPGDGRLHELCEYLDVPYTSRLDAVFEVKHGF